MWNNPPGRIEVLIWLAEPLLRAGVRATLRMTDNLCIAEGAQPSGAAAHVVVTDWTSALLFTEAERNADLPPLLPQSRILVICPQAREYPIASARCVGVHGVVRSSCTGDELIAAIRALAQGSVYICPEIAQRTTATGWREELTGREGQVLQLMARGQCNKIIARHLGIAVGTVKAHVKGIMAKLGASSRTEAASIASEKGIVDVRAFRSSSPAWGVRDPMGTANNAAHTG